MIVATGIYLITFLTTLLLAHSIFTAIMTGNNAEAISFGQCVLPFTVSLVRPCLHEPLPACAPACTHPWALMIELAAAVQVPLPYSSKSPIYLRSSPLASCAPS